MTCTKPNMPTHKRGNTAARMRALLQRVGREYERTWCGRNISCGGVTKRVGGRIRSRPRCKSAGAEGCTCGFNLFVGNWLLHDGLPAGCLWHPVLRHGRRGRHLPDQRFEAGQVLCPWPELLPGEGESWLDVAVFSG